MAGFSGSGILIWSTKCRIETVGEADSRVLMVLAKPLSAIRDARAQIAWDASYG